MKTDIAVIQTELKNVKETTDKGFGNIEKRFDNIEKRFDSHRKTLRWHRKEFDRQNNIIIACIGIPMGFLAIYATVWGILANMRSRNDQILEKQIETLTQEIETLKQRHIVSP